MTTDFTSESPNIAQKSVLKLSSTLGKKKERKEIIRYTNDNNTIKKSELMVCLQITRYLWENPLLLWALVFFYVKWVR